MTTETKADSAPVIVVPWRYGGRTKADAVCMGIGFALEVEGHESAFAVFANAPDAERTAAQWNCHDDLLEACRNAYLNLATDGVRHTVGDRVYSRAFGPLRAAIARAKRGAA